MSSGGKRKGAGRKPSGRRQITVSIKSQVLDELGPRPHMKIRHIVENKNARLVGLQRLYEPF